MNASEESSPDLRDESSLCAAAVAGDESAVSALIRLHHARFVGYVHRKLGPAWAGRIEPEDVLQEAYVDVFASIGGLTEPTPDAFFRFATRIIEHKFIDQLRRWRSRKRDVRREAAAGPAGERSVYDQLVDHVLSPNSTASRVVRREEAVGAMLACLARLPEHYREAVRRFHLEGEPLARIAKDLDRTEEAVRKLVTRGLGQLRTCLGRASRYFSESDHGRPT